MSDPNWVKAAIYAGLATFAGGLGYVLRSMESGVPVQLTRTIVEALAAGFVGLLVMWVCTAAGMSPEWTAVIVGVAGWLGANASIQVLQRFVWRKLGIAVQAPTEQEAPDDKSD